MTQSAENDALVALIEENQGLCVCGHDANGDHNSLGCYAAITYSPLVRCDCKRDHGGGTEAETLARVILAAGYRVIPPGTGDRS